MNTPTPSGKATDRSPFQPDPHFHARKQLEKQDERGGYAGIDPKAAKRATKRGGVTGGV